MAIEGTYVPSTADWVRDQVALYESSGGTKANTLRDTGIPIVVVTMIGNKTGNVRKIALMRVEHEGAYALVASYGGRPSHPEWYHNLLANPNSVSVQDGATPSAVSVREVNGEEKAAWWARCVAVFPNYADYQAKTDREIPVLVATPRS